jgi:hypothetical protein
MRGQAAPVDMIGAVVVSGHFAHGMLTHRPDRADRPRDYGFDMRA